MHECEYCGDVNCTKRGCIEATLALADYWDALAHSAYWRDPEEKLDD